MKLIDPIIYYWVNFFQNPVGQHFLTLIGFGYLISIKLKNQTGIVILILSFMDKLCRVFAFHFDIITTHLPFYQSSHCTELSISELVALIGLISLSRYQCNTFALVFIQYECNATNFCNRTCYQPDIYNYCTIYLMKEI